MMPSGDNLMSKKKKSVYQPLSCDGGLTDAFGLFFGLCMMAAIVFAVVLVFFVY